MQDLLGNIIAGMALQASKSFVHGDWLLIDNRHAEVIEINWRSTRMRTIDDISVEVPNREIARQTIINLNRPHRLHAIRIPVTLDYSAPPTRAIVRFILAWLWVGIPLACGVYFTVMKSLPLFNR